MILLRQSDFGLLKFIPYFIYNNSQKINALEASLLRSNNFSKFCGFATTFLTWHFYKN